MHYTAKALRRYSANMFKSDFLEAHKGDSNNKVVEDRNSTVRVNRLAQLEENNLLVHSFSENFIYGFKTSEKLNNQSSFSFGQLINKKRIAFSDFLTESEGDLSFERLFKTIRSNKLMSREYVDEMINSGNLAIDFTNPLLKGTFNSVNIKSQNTVKRDKVLEGLLKFNENIHTIYLTPKTDRRDRFDNLAKKANTKAEYNIIEIDVSKRDELLLTLKILPYYADYLQKINKNVVILLDDIESLYFDLFNLHKTDNDEVS